jgi:hypothetical protein
VQLRTSDRAVRQTDVGYTLSLSPSAKTVLTAQSPQFADLSAGGERLDLTDLSTD